MVLRLLGDNAWNQRAGRCVFVPCRELQIIWGAFLQLFCFFPSFSHFRILNLMALLGTTFTVSADRQPVARTCSAGCVGPSGVGVGGAHLQPSLCTHAVCTHAAPGFHQSHLTTLCAGHLPAERCAREWLCRHRGVPPMAYGGCLWHVVVGKKGPHSARASASLPAA